MFKVNVSGDEYRVKFHRPEIYEDQQLKEIGSLYVQSKQAKKENKEEESKRLREAMDEVHGNRTNQTICVISSFDGESDTILGQGVVERNPKDNYDKGVAERYCLMRALKEMLGVSNLHHKPESDIANVFIEAHNNWIARNNIKTSIRLDTFIQA